MRKLFLLFCALGSLFVSCASGPKGQEKTMASLGENVVPGPNQSEIVIVYPSTVFHQAEGVINVFIDGVMVAQVKADSSERIIVSNGQHTLVIRRPGGRKFSVSRKVDIKSQRMAFSVASKPITLGLGKPTVMPLAGLSAAAENIAKNLLGKLPNGSTVAVLNISTRRAETENYVISELEHFLVNSKQYKIVDRNRIDAVRREQHFQMSGEVSDETAVSIGQMSGASIVITGSIIESGNTQTLSVKALDVMTLDIVAMEREHYQGDGAAPPPRARDADRQRGSGRSRNSGE